MTLPILRGPEAVAALEKALAPARAAGRPLGVLLLSLHGLRRFNIQRGHVDGETLVEGLADIARRILRPGDEVVRVGGSDLMVLLPSVRDVQHAMLAATRLLREFETPMTVGGRPVLPWVTMGIALSPDHGTDAGRLLRHAEASLELARESPDRMAVTSPQEFDAGIEPADLRAAIQNDEMSVHFQPFLDLRSGRVSGVEALARWTHPRRGPISPALFVTLAETSGMIAELTRWSINATLQHAVAARDRGLHLPVSINLSAVAFNERGLVEHLVGALRLWNVPADDLVIEVTETAIIADLDQGARILGRLSDAGIRVSIDDFGVGNSSFAYLRQFPATELKMDRSFVTGMLSHDRSMSLVRAMIDFSHQMGIRVVAEGIEDFATRDALAALGCDYGQGYAIGRPEPAAAYVARLAAG